MDQNEPPPQRPVLPREIILEHRRRRFSDALAELCAEKGFRETTVADIVARAGTSRNAFYELFSDRDEAFMTLMESGTQDLLGRVEAGCVAGGDEPERRVKGGLTGAVDWVADRPHDARACLVDAAGATPTSQSHLQAVVSRLASMLKEAAPSATPRPDSLEEYLVGGVQYMLRRLVVGGEADRARDLLPDLSGLLLAPYLSDRGREG